MIDAGVVYVYIYIYHEERRHEDPKNDLYLRERALVHDGLPHRPAARLHVRGRVGGRVRLRPGGLEAVAYLFFGD